MAQKFIINNNRILFGHSGFARQLAKDHSQTVGGGRWHFDPAENSIYLYGSSLDFGPVTKEQVQAAWSYALEGRKVYFSNEILLDRAIKNCELVQSPEHA